MVQWVRLHVPNAGGLGLIADQGTRSHMLLLKLSHAATKTQRSQIILKNKWVRVSCL